MGANARKEIRLSNADIERMLVEKYAKQGYDVVDAYRHTGGYIVAVAQKIANEDEAFCDKCGAVMPLEQVCVVCAP